MGLPTSWAILSLIHLWWMDEVKKTSSGRSNQSMHKFLICGDDALLSTTEAGAARYKEIVADCGGSESKGKHFESRAAGGGILRGVFLEKLFEFDRREHAHVIDTGRRFGAIPVKSLCSKNLPAQLNPDALPLRCNSAGLI